MSEVSPKPTRRKRKGAAKEAALPVSEQVVSTQQPKQTSKEAPKRAKGLVIIHH